MTSASKFEELYPDLVREGGVVNALQQALRSIASPLEVRGSGVARVGKDRRSSQVYTAAETRLFLHDFWDRGVMLAHASTPDLAEVARSIHAWVNERVTTAQLRLAFPLVVLEPIAEPFENDMEVEWQWQRIEERANEENHMAELLPLVVAARKRTELQQLFPFTSHVSLCLSRCTGYPYSGDCPHAIPVRNGLYQVHDASGKVVGTADAEGAAQLLIDHLPPNAGRARKGTADDL